jgi:hypothetical protein
MKTNNPVSVFAIISVATIFPVSVSWAIGPQTQMISAGKNQDVIAEFTVPVRLSSLDRKIRSGKVTCTVIQKESSDNMFGLGGLGSGNSIFSINSNDGSYSGSVKISVVPQKNVTPSNYAGGLKYACWLYLSPDNNIWTIPNASAKQDMFQPKPNSNFVAEVTGSIPASK